MVGIWQSYSDTYLIVAGVAMLISFGIPLMLFPLRWARLFRWEIHEQWCIEKDPARYRDGRDTTQPCS